MRRACAFLALLGMTACTGEPVKPSPTTDQVLAAQYRARGEWGEMNGAEAQAVMDAYRRDIAKPAESEAGSSSSSSSSYVGGLMSLH